eukprot:6475899-Amphidinium_carterae.2
MIIESLDPEKIATITGNMHQQLASDTFGSVSHTKKRKVSITYRGWELAMDVLSFEDEWELRLNARLRELCIGLELIPALR